MYEALHELALLSQCLPNRTTSVAYTDKLINHSFWFIDGMGERPRTKVLEALLGTVPLKDNAKIVCINRQTMPT